MTTTDRPRERLTAICTALPEAVAKPSGRHVGYTVRSRTFAYFLDDHQGDGRVALNCKVEPGENGALVAADPDHFHIPAYLGHRGWVGVDLDRPDTDWDHVEALVLRSYRLVAPKKLVAQLNDGG